MIMYKNPEMASYLGSTVSSVSVLGYVEGLLPGENYLSMYKGPVMGPYLKEHRVSMYEAPVVAFHMGSTVFQCTRVL